MRPCWLVVKKRRGHHVIAVHLACTRGERVDRFDAAQSVPKQMEALIVCYFGQSSDGFHVTLVAGPQDRIPVKSNRKGDGDVTANDVVVDSAGRGGAFGKRL